MSLFRGITGIIRPYHETIMSTNRKQRKEERRMMKIVQVSVKRQLLLALDELRAITSELRSMRGLPPATSPKPK